MISNLALLPNSVATGCGLYALIQSFSSISGAHFNPAVSLVERLCGRLSTNEFLFYSIVQVLGGIVGVFLVHSMFGQSLLQFSTHDRGEFRYQYSADENQPIVSHSKRQLGPSLDPYVHIKILSPWMIEEKSGVNFLFSGSSWNYPEKLFDWNIVPGVINFKNQSSTHVNLFMPAKTARLEITAGDPIVHILPISEKEIELRQHLLTEKEFENKMLRYSFMSSFMGRYKKNAKR
jgi:hypothetical protein